MSTEGQEAQAEVQGETSDVSLLDAAISHTKNTEPDRAKELIETLTQQAMEGTVTWDKNVDRTIELGIVAIDKVLSKQLAEIIHAPKFLKLEGSWRGLNKFVMGSETGESLKIRLLNSPKRELAKDLDKAVEFDQSILFKKIYENEFGTAGGEPYGLLVGDYEYTNHPEDIDMLSKISNVAGAAFAPFISAADPGTFGLESFNELSKPRDMAKLFDTADYAKWKSFRETEDSRFVSLCMPRVMARLPYGTANVSTEEFSFEEFDLGDKGQTIEQPHKNFCWSNAAYAMASNMTRTFSETGFCVAIRGAEGGGKLHDLPTYTYTTPSGDIAMKCPTEVPITDRREAELSSLGYLSLCHYKDTAEAVFFGGQTTQKPKKYDNPNVTANAEISARLPYIMAMSRFTHYLKIIGRDKIGSFMELSDCDAFLNRWITQFVTSDPSPSSDIKARYPLAEAKVEVKEVPGSPGAYNAVVHMRPWLQMEELTASMRCVARIPT